MTDFALQVAFQSDAEPWKTNQVIAVSYAWAVMKPNGKWSGQGQRPNNRAEQLQVGDRLAFSFVDVASNPVSEITNVVVKFDPGPTAKSGQNVSPLGGGQSFGYPQRSLTSGFESAGCNVEGRGWDSGLGYTIEHDGDFEVTVSFTAGGKRFGVDPEMEVIRVG